MLQQYAHLLNKIMKVEIYDQYKDIYLDKTTDKLTEVSTVVGQSIDLNRYTLVHSGVGSTTVIGENLSLEEACDLVTTTYLDSKTLGVSYDDKLLKLNEGYAELMINFNDGKVLTRVIYIRN